MNTFIEALQNFSLVGGLLAIPFVIILYFLFATDDRDAFFFLRNHFLRKKMKTHSIQSIDTMVSALLETQRNSWSIDKGNMTYYPFANDKKTRFVFEKDRFYKGQHELILFEHKSEKFSITQLKDSASFRIYNRMDNSTGEQTYQSKANTLFSFLFSLLEDKQLFDVFTTEKTQEEAVKPVKTFKELFDEKEHILSHALSNPSLWKTKSLDEFQITLAGSSDVKIASLSFQNVNFFTATNQYGQISFQFENQDSEFFPMFEHLKVPLEHYFMQHLRIDNSSKQLSKYELTNASLPKLELGIQSLLSDLSQDLNWLSETNRQKVLQMYPSDVSSLLESFQHSPDTEEQVTNSLKKIYKSLKMMEYQIENQKQRMKIKQKKVVETIEAE